METPASYRGLTGGVHSHSIDLIVPSAPKIGGICERTAIRTQFRDESVTISTGGSVGINGLKCAGSSRPPTSGGACHICCTTAVHGETENLIGLDCSPEKGGIR